MGGGITGGKEIRRGVIVVVGITNVTGNGCRVREGVYGIRVNVGVEVVTVV